jgi:exodeoxyribonuclease VII large subunit
VSGEAALGAQGVLDLERRVFRVSELTRAIRGLLEKQYADLWVEGEISNFRAHGSGHWYFTLKDAEAQIRAAMFRKENLRLRFRPEDGMKVLCRGRITVYEARGEYQLVALEMEPRGSGALLLAFERLKTKLAAEGLFAPERKRKLPLLPRRLGVVTSPTGAAIRDILEVVRRRDPRMSVLICPVRVQGEGAAAEIADGIRRLSHSGLVDVIIAGRGGGSIEDLWAFNEEVVARAIFECAVPVVSAVGHEVDVTIADFVADVRAPTPSAAAEIAVPVRAELRARILDLRARGGRGLLRRLGELRHRLEAAKGRVEDPRRLLARRRIALDDALNRCGRIVRGRLLEARNRLSGATASLRQRHPSARVARARQRIADLRHRLEALKTQRLAAHRRAFEVMAGKLETLSPLAILGRGYAIARRESGAVVMRAADVRREERLEVLVAEGKLEVRVEDAVAVDPARRPVVPEREEE